MRERLPSVVHLTEDIPVEEPNKYRYRKRPIIPLISYVKCLLNILVGSRAKSDDNSQWIQLPHHRCQLPPTIQMFRINFYNEFVFPRRCARMFNQWIAVKSVTSLIKTNLHWKRQTIRQDHIYPFMAAFFNKRLRPPLESGNANAFRFF